MLTCFELLPSTLRAHVESFAATIVRDCQRRTKVLERERYPPMELENNLFYFSIIDFKLKQCTSH